MSIRILDRFGLLESLSSIDTRKALTSYSSLNIGDPDLMLVSKKEIYTDVLGISDNNLPNLVYKVSYDEVNSEFVRSVDNYKPDVVVTATYDSIVEFIKHKPRAVFIFDNVNGIIRYGDLTINIQFSDLLDENVKTLTMDQYKETRHLLRKYEYSDIYSQMRHELNLEVIKSNPKYYYHTAASNIIRRLVIEFVGEYRDNPTLTHTSTPNPNADLLSIIDKQYSLIEEMKKQLDELKSKIM